jgi:DeoR family fructose operon transcriptional repressor
MYSVQRQSKILELLVKNGEVEVSDLADKFTASRETIRRDLREMEASGLLKRTHGGAVPVEKKYSDGYEYPLQARGLQHYEEKQRICRETAKLVEDGDTIFMDNSSTTMNLLKYLPEDFKITIITNSIQVLLEAGRLENNNIVVISVGGMFNPKNFSLTGLLSNNYARSFFPDKSIVSCRGIDEKSGITDSSFLEIEVKRKMIDQSKQLIVMADYSKFGQTGAVYVGKLNEINVLITDSKTDPEKLKMFSEFDTRIIIAE